MSEPISHASESVRKSVQTIHEMTESIKNAAAIFILVILSFITALVAKISYDHARAITSTDFRHVCFALLAPLFLIVVVGVVRLVLYIRFELGT